MVWPVCAACGVVFWLLRGWCFVGACYLSYLNWHLFPLCLFCDNLFESADGKSACFSLFYEMNWGFTASCCSNLWSTSCSIAGWPASVGIVALSCSQTPLLLHVEKKGFLVFFMSFLLLAHERCSHCDVRLELSWIKCLHALNEKRRAEAPTFDTLSFEL